MNATFHCSLYPTHNKHTVISPNCRSAVFLGFSLHHLGFNWELNLWSSKSLQSSYKASTNSIMSRNTKKANHQCSWCQACWHVPMIININSQAIHDHKEDRYWFIWPVWSYSSWLWNTQDRNVLLVCLWIMHYVPKSGLLNELPLEQQVQEWPRHIQIKL